MSRVFYEIQKHRNRGNIHKDRLSIRMIRYSMSTYQTEA